MPDLIRHPEIIEITGFPLQFTPDSIRGGNDEKREVRTFYETIKITRVDFKLII